MTPHNTQTRTSRKSLTTPGAPHLVAQYEIGAAAMRTERVMAVVRILFVLATTFRTFFFSRPPLARIFGLLVPICAILFSLYVLFRKSKQAPRALLFCSVALDVLGGFLALLNNVLFPPPLSLQEYIPILQREDSFALFLILFATGLRLSPWVVLFGGALTLGACFSLHTIEAVLHGSVYRGGLNPLSIYLIYLSTMTGLTMYLAYLTNRLVSDAAKKARTAKQARTALDSILEEHHDASSLLSSLTINTELLSLKIPNMSGLESVLQRDLDELRNKMQQLKERAYEKALSLKPVEVAKPAVLLAALTQHITRRYPHIHLTVTSSFSQQQVLYAGGTFGLQATLTKLLENACQGNGTQAATEVTLDAFVAKQSEFVCLCVRDNGPGFSEKLIQHFPQTTWTTKNSGLGWGLHFVYTQVENSEGSLALSNTKEGGALVCLTLKVLD